MFSKWIEEREVTITSVNFVSNHLDMRRKAQNYEISIFYLSTANITTPSYAASWNELGWYVSTRLMLRKSLGVINFEISYCTLVIGIVSIAIIVWIFIDVYKQRCFARISEEWRKHKLIEDEWRTYASVN